MAEPISWGAFAIIAISCIITMLICRTAPFLLLRGRALPEWLSRALTFIPAAAFSALIANDLLGPTMFDAGFWPGFIPLMAALAVVPVAIKTRSLVWSIVVGVGVFGVLLLF